MRISTRNRIATGFFVSVALIFTTIALFSCHWLDFDAFNIASYSKGLFSQSGCTFYVDGTPSWNTATFVLMIIAFSCEIIVLAFIIISSLIPHCNHHMMNIDIFLCFLIFATQTAALITYGISATNYFDGQVGSQAYHMGWSYWLVIPGAVFGLFAISPLIHAHHAILHHGEDVHWH